MSVPTFDPVRVPMSFRCGDRMIRDLSTLPILSQTSETDTRCIKNTIRYAVTDTLELEIHTTRWLAYNAYEWYGCFVNTGSDNSPVVSDVNTADMFFDLPSAAVQGILGDHENQYRPYKRPLRDGGMHFTSVNGRPTHIWFPYFHLTGENEGAFVTIGWGGTWKAAFTPLPGDRIHFTARGPADFCAYLKPGESLRTPLITVLPDQGLSEADAQNLWRRWFIHCCLPHADGKPIRPFSTVILCNDTGLPNSDGSISERSFTWRRSMERIISEDLRATYRWFDAGWYPDPAGNFVETEWWSTVGTWELDKRKWPDNSFRESTDFARAHGMKTLVWFEPERVTHVDDLVRYHGYNPAWALPDDNGIFANNIGDPECRRWTTERILRMLGENGVEMYREDNNSNAAPCWIRLDAAQGENRRGVTESMAVDGHYKMWDDIIAFTSSHGGDSFVDACASGGGRNDLESMRRSVPLLRSDSDRTSTALRLSMTTSFNFWIPFCGCSTREQIGQLDAEGVRDMYVWRASFNCVMNLCDQWTLDADLDYDLLRRQLREWESVRDLLLADFYLLTPWNEPTCTDNWTSFAYFDPEAEKGALLAFRQETCAQDTLTVELPACMREGYALRDADSGEFTPAGQYFTVCCGEPRTARLFYIEKVQ